MVVANKSFDCGRCFEHWVKDQEVGASAFADFETNDCQRVAWDLLNMKTADREDVVLAYAYLRAGDRRAVTLSGLSFRYLSSSPAGSTLIYHQVGHHGQKYLGWYRRRRPCI